jgi:NAD(P)-dependent dehydrogenase (short-subunit alcohol dehydrogenase family)
MSEYKRVAIVFGAAGGIGSALVRKLSTQGVSLALVGRSDDKLRLLADEIPGSIPLVADVTQQQQVASSFQEAESRLGQVTEVAHCVGSILLKSAHQLRDEEWNETLSLNLFSSFYVLRSCTTLWTRQSIAGSVVFCSSAAATVGLANHEAIAAAKAGLEGLVRSAAATYASRGIRVNAVAPGLVRTPLARRITESEPALKASLAAHPLKRIGEPNDIASAMSWLLSPEQSWVTGQVLGVDGGLSRLKVLS